VIRDIQSRKCYRSGNQAITCVIEHAQRNAVHQVAATQILHKFPRLLLIPPHAKGFNRVLWAPEKVDESEKEGKRERETRI
jgi:hypothetical protein